MTDVHTVSLVWRPARKKMLRANGRDTAIDNFRVYQIPDGVRGGDSVIDINSHITLPITPSVYIGGHYNAFTHFHF